jgi:hypothetical protein
VHEGFAKLRSELMGSSSLTAPGGGYARPDDFRVAARA